MGGTKVEIAQIHEDGRMGRRLRRETHASRGAKKIEEDIVSALKELQQNVGSAPRAMGVGVAGQVEGRTGKVRFAPNLNWHDVPLQADLQEALNLPVRVANDVYAVTQGEWLHGAGKDCRDLVCLFIGTGIGGGVVSGGRQLEGASHTAGELGHIIIDFRSDIVCPCGNRGCLEALAGGTAIGRRARDLVTRDRAAGGGLLKLAENDPEKITGETVAKAFHHGDALARRLMGEVKDAVVAGAVSIAHAFNPALLILGGGVVDGFPELVDWVGQGVADRALEAARIPFAARAAKLGDDAGVIGAAMLALGKIKTT